MYNESHEGGEPVVPRGVSVPEGSIRIAQNGYHYTKVEKGKWRLTHHIVAEEKLGRPLEPWEGVYFADSDRKNLKPENIQVRRKGKQALTKQLADLYKKKAEITEQIAEIERRMAIRQDLNIES